VIGAFALDRRRMIAGMTETPENPTHPTSVAPTEPAHAPLVRERPSRLAVVALWVAIVAGIVFIVAVIFFSGFAMGRHAGGGGGHHHWNGQQHGAHGFAFHHPHPMGSWGAWGPGPGGFPGGPGGGPGGFPGGPGGGPGGYPGGPGGPGGPTSIPAPPSPTATPHP
jgi:hypothetical protein